MTHNKKFLLLWLGLIVLWVVDLILGAATHAAFPLLVAPIGAGFSVYMAFKTWRRTREGK